jgi:hypothetical protein
VIAMKDIEELEKEVWDRIANATKRKESTRIASLNNVARDIEKVKKEIERIEYAINESEYYEPTQDEKSVVFEITQGALNQNYLPIKEMKRHNLIPTDGREFLVETSVGLSFRTKISNNGQWLSARGKTGEYFRKASIKAGDRIKWKESSPYRYQLSKL